MRLYIILLTFIGVTMSCTEKFNPEIDLVSSPLVVDGLITDEAVPYIIRLYTSSQYNSQGYNNVPNAKVSVMDDRGNIYKFTETTAGVYTSNPTIFVGKPGRSYSLHIETNGDVYESTPQLLLPNNFEVKASAEFTSEDYLVYDDHGDPQKHTKTGVDLLVNIKNNSDTIPRFRFWIMASYKEYVYSMQGSDGLILYYGWNLEDQIDNLNITDGYQTSSTDIQNHKVCFIPDEINFKVLDIDPLTKRDTLVPASIVNRVVKVLQYRLNNETFQFYKNVKALLLAQGKIFDPIASQLQGNITCKTNQKKLGLGFFEASSVQTKIYTNAPNYREVKQYKSFDPPTSDGTLNFWPEFWLE